MQVCWADPRPWFISIRSPGCSLLPKSTSSCLSICFSSVHHISPCWLHVLFSPPQWCPFGVCDPVLAALPSLGTERSNLCLSSSSPWGSTTHPWMVGVGHLSWGHGEVVTEGGQKVFSRGKKIQRLFLPSPLRWLSVGSSVGSRDASSAALPAAPGCQKGSSGLGTGAVLSVEVFHGKLRGR